MSNTVPTPPPEPARHGIAETLRLIDRIRTIAYDLTLEAGDAMRRIRDLFADHDRPEGSTTP